MHKGIAVFATPAILLGGYFMYERYRPAPSAPQKSAKSSPSDLMPYARPAVPEDDTADWQTYRNEKYGFEMKYPPDFTLEEQIRGGEELTFLVATFMSPDGKIELYSYYRDYENERQGTLQNYPRCFGDEKLKYSLSGYVIDEQKVKNDVLSSCGSGWMLPHKDKLFFFFSDIKIGGQIFDRVVSTFKFIKER